MVTVQLPSLRERPEDIPVLVQHFLKRENARQTVPEAVQALLRAYQWPGNVRELENAIRRMIALAPASEVRVQDLPAEIQGGGSASAAASGLTGDLERIEKNAILAAMNESGWNQSRAARVLGVGRTALQYKMKKYGIQKPGT